MILKLKIFSILLIMVAISFAQAITDEAESINNWDDVKRLLKQQNIDYFTINLLDIDNYCVSQVNASDVSAFNICRYKTAVLTYSYDNDQKICSNNAETAYPDSLVVPAQLIPIISSVDKKGKVTIIYLPYSSYDNSALQRDRNKLFQSCMEKLSWNNPYDWKSGKSVNNL